MLDGLATSEATEEAMPTALTALELDLLTRFHTRYNASGFPHPSQVRVTARRNTGAGRFTYLDHEGSVQTPNGQLDLGRYSQFDMSGLEAGASFSVQVENARLAYLEIVVNGEAEWDGSERPWFVIDPDTGEPDAAQNAV
jgi:hypothetical protein